MKKIKNSNQKKSNIKKSVMSKSKLFDLSRKQMQTLVFLFAVLLYAVTISFDFTLDDALMITSNEYTKQGVSGITSIFSNDAFVGFFGQEKELVAGGRYRPLTHAMFALEYQVFGANPIVGHFMNILLYAILALIVFRTLEFCFRHSNSSSSWIHYIPFTATLLFVAHPLHTEVVANIKGRDEIISMGGSMLALLFSLKFIEKPRPLYLFYSFAAMLVGMFSKENTITFLAIVPLAIYMFTNAKLKDYIITFIPLFAASVIFIAARINALGFFMKTTIQTEILNNPFIHASKGEEIATVLYTWLIYLKLLAFPHPLTHDYYPWHITIKTVSEPPVILAFLTVGILIVLALLKLPKKSVVSFGILFFFITFSIQSNLLFNIGTFMNERFMFVALLGFCIILGYYMSQYYHRFRKISVLFLIVLGLYSVKSFTRTLAWKDNFTLFTTDVLVSSNSAKVNVSAAEVIIKQTEQEKHADKSKQMFQQALEYLIKAQTIHPTYFGAYDLAGKAAFHLDDYMASFSYYKQCLKINPNAIVPLNNIHLVAQAALAKEQTDNAEEMVLWLIDFAPDSLQFQYEMALIYEKKKEFNKSLDVLHNIIESNPDYVKAWSKAGEIYGKYLQNINKSEMYLLEAWKLKPDDFGVNENLGIVYGMLNKFALSIEYFNNALQIDSSVARLHSNMSNTYALMGNTEKAVYHEKKAQKFQKKIL